MSVRFCNQRKRWILDQVVDGKRTRTFHASPPREVTSTPKKVMPSLRISDLVSRYRALDLPRKGPRAQREELSMLRRFYDWCRDHGFASTADLSVFDLETYVEHLRSLGLSAATINRQVTPIRHMFNVAFRRGEIEVNLWTRVPKLKEQSTPHAVWSKECFDAVELALGLRDREFLWGLKLTGLRPSQLASVALADVDLVNGRLATQSLKGGQLRRYTVPLGDQMLALCRFRAEHSKTWLFERKRGQRFCRIAFTKRVRLAAQAAGFGRMTSYGLRHTFGTELSQAGVPIQHIAPLMGHAKITTTQRYIRESEAQLRSAVDLLSRKEEGGLAANGSSGSRAGALLQHAVRSDQRLIS